MDVPLPRARRRGCEPVAHDDGPGTDIDHVALRARERAAVRLLRAAAHDVVARVRLEARDLAGERAIVQALALAAVEGDGVGGARLLVPARPVRRAVAIVIAGGEREPASLRMDDDAVLVGVAVGVGAVGTRLDVDRAG